MPFLTDGRLLEIEGLCESGPRWNPTIEIPFGCVPLTRFFAIDPETGQRTYLGQMDGIVMWIAAPRGLSLP